VDGGKKAAFGEGIWARMGWEKESEDCVALLDEVKGELLTRGWEQAAMELKAFLVGRRMRGRRRLLNRLVLTGGIALQILGSPATG